MKSQIMYVGGPSGGRIGRVRFSKTGRTMYYGDLVLAKSERCLTKANCFDENTGNEYWVSGCKKNGKDTLYPGIVEIDEDVREEYWGEIRRTTRHGRANTVSFRGQALQKETGIMKPLSEETLDPADLIEANTEYIMLRHDWYLLSHPDCPKDKLKIIEEFVAWCVEEDKKDLDAPRAKDGKSFRQRREEAQ
jgi:hypothetical protein